MLFLLDIRVYCVHVVFIVPSPLKYRASMDLPTDHWKSETLKNGCHVDNLISGFLVVNSSIVDRD